MPNSVDSGLPSSIGASTTIRTAHVGVYLLTSIAQAGIVQFGDRGETFARLRALAVQRQEDHSKAGEFFFESYDIFDRPLPKMNDPDYEEGQGVRMVRENCSNRINVGCVRVIASGSAASLLTGNSMRYGAESRIKHIRQYKASKPFPPVGPPLPLLNPLPPLPPVPPSV